LPAAAERCAVMVGRACADGVVDGGVAGAVGEPDEFAVLHAPIQRRQFRAGAAQQVAVGGGIYGSCGDEQCINIFFFDK